MRRGILLAGTAAVLSFAGLSAASAQVIVADPGYVEPVYAAPAYAYEPDYVVTAPAIGGYVQPRYSYSVNTPAYPYGYTSTGYYGRGVCGWNNGTRFCY